MLIHDRANISPEVMEHLRDDIIKVISNYMEINQKDMEISLANDDDSVALVADTGAEDEAFQGLSGIYKNPAATFQRLRPVFL